MASIILDHLWIHRADDPADHLTLTLDAATPTAAVDGEFETFGGGRVRLRRGPGTRRTVEYRCEQVPRAAIEQLQDWVGQVLLWRDPRGGRMYGAYLEQPTVWLPGGLEVGDVTLTVTRIDRVEEV